MTCTVDHDGIFFSIMLLSTTYKSNESIDEQKK